MEILQPGLPLLFLSKMGGGLGWETKGPEMGMDTVETRVKLMAWACVPALYTS